MPAHRRKQSNAMLYTLITFVGLFIATTTVAVIYYVKAEEYRNRHADLQREIDNIATDRERQALGSIIGTKLPGKTWLATMVDYFDKSTTMIAGGVAEQTSAEVKLNNSRTEVNNIQKLAQETISIGDPNTTGLIQIARNLKTELDNTIKARLETENKYNDLDKRFNDMLKTNHEESQTLLAQKAELLQQVTDRKQAYDEQSSLLEQTTGERVKNLTDQLQQTRDEMKSLNDKMLKIQEELKIAHGDLKSEKEKLSKIEPGPDREVLAYKPDGKIILVDDQAQVVHLNIGKEDHVYPGLTFTVYDRGASIPPDGKGKAEIEVFDLAKTYCSARITKSKINNPILPGDIVANLIWDPDRTNVFVVAGDFDLDNSGQIDGNGPDKIKELIEKWGGRVDNAISVDTNYLVLGAEPQVLQKPTPEELDINPSAMETYNASLERLARYNDLRNQAQTLWIPVFTYDKFLYFIGYKGRIGEAGAF
jgi:hypothetical protein